MNHDVGHGSCSNDQAERPRLTDLLSQLQALLIELGLWQTQSPSTEALASGQPFCIDTLELHQWLQFIFIPRLNSMMAQGQRLPGDSGVAAMAEEVYRADARIAKPLCALLQKIDSALAQQAAE